MTIRLSSSGSTPPFASSLPLPASWRTSELPSTLTASLYVPQISAGVPCTTSVSVGDEVSQLGVRGDQAGEQQHEGGGGDHQEPGSPNGERTRHDPESTGLSARTRRRPHGPPGRHPAGIRRRRYDRRHPPASEPTRADPRPDRHVHRRAPRERPARHRRRGPPRPGGRGQPLVRRRVQARDARPDRVRAPLRARDVPGLEARREGRAHRHRPGRRRHDERVHVAGPDQLLRDAAGAPAGARALARGGPDGDAPRRAEPGEPRQPARGRQEREALVLRQPPVRVVAGEGPGPPVPAGAPVPPLDDRLDGGPRRGLARGRDLVLPHLVRAEQRGAVDRRRRRDRDGPRGGRALLRGHPVQPVDPAARRPVAAADARRGAARDRARPRPAAADLRRVPRPGLRRPPARRARHRRPDPRRREGEPPRPAARPRRADRPGRGDLQHGLHRRRVDHRRLGHRPTRASTSPASRPPSTRSSSG